MQIKLKTSKLQEMVAKSIKGASSNKMIPLTSLMDIRLKGDTLVLKTTDAINTLSVIATGIEGEDFHTVVPCEVFSKLVAKTTSETITLTMQENSLEVKGNGRYNIELPLNDDGALVAFPIRIMPTSEDTILQTSLIKSILTANKAAIAQTMEQPYLTGYYFGEQVITTDSFKVCSNALKLLPTERLLSPETVELLALMSSEKISVKIDGNMIAFVSPDIVILGSAMAGISDYPVLAIEDYLKTEFVSNCTLPKLALLDVLERLALFVSIYDKNGIYINFMESGIQFSSKRSNGIETIAYTTQTNFSEFTCCVDLELFKSQVVAQETENVELWFGHDRALKMVSGKITQIVSLLEDDRVSGQTSA